MAGCLDGDERANIGKRMYERGNSCVFGEFWQHTPRQGRLRLRQNGTLEAINLEYDADSLYLLLMLYMGHTLVQNVVI